MAIRVYDTLRRRKVLFEPVSEGHVGIYLCGPTVYRASHVGHMVGPVVFDAIKRHLVHSGYAVTWVVNVTDVDDKLIAESHLRSVPVAEIAAEMTQEYRANLEALGVDGIDHMPRATGNIDEIVGLIGDLVARGHAYESGGDVYFEVSSDAAYGELSNRGPESLQGEGGEGAERKRSPRDFALWKAGKPGEPSWDSPWGPGRPGWHVECSAMSRRLLGRTFDIHAGGLDLVFPHHENERAQSECAHGVPMVRYWMHNGLLRPSSAAGKLGGRGETESADVDAQVEAKLSRSRGAGGLADQIARHGGERVRFLLLRTHYRSGIVFDESALREVGSALEGFYRFFERFERAAGRSFWSLEPVASREAGALDPGEDALLHEVSRHRDAYLEAMDDDFNTSAAVRELFELLRALNRHLDTEGDVAALVRGAGVLRELSSLLGLFCAPPAREGAGDPAQLSGLVELLIEVREAARASRDFATADRIRDRLAELGITLEDRSDGTGWRRG